MRCRVQAVSSRSQWRSTAASRPHVHASGAQELSRTHMGHRHVEECPAGSASSCLVEAVVEAEDGVVGHSLAHGRHQRGRAHRDAPVVRAGRLVPRHLLLHVAEVPAAARGAHEPQQAELLFSSRRRLHGELPRTSIDSWLSPGQLGACHLPSVDYSCTAGEAHREVLRGHSHRKLPGMNAGTSAEF